MGEAAEGECPKGSWAGERAGSAGSLPLLGQAGSSKPPERGGTRMRTTMRSTMLMAPSARKSKVYLTGIALGAPLR